MAKTHTPPPLPDEVWRASMREVEAAVLDFCDCAPELGDPDPATRQALARLIRLANVVRATQPGKACGHQNEDYPDMRCTKRRRHRGRHARPASGATWG